MQRFKIKLLGLLFSFILFCNVSCQNINSLVEINYRTLIVELDTRGRETKIWTPVQGTIKLDIYSDNLFFVDSVTKTNQKITGSYKLIETVK